MSCVLDGKRDVCVIAVRKDFDLDIPYRTNNPPANSHTFHAVDIASFHCFSMPIRRNNIDFRPYYDYHTATMAFVSALNMK
ncbi:hypothetical protein Trydic_g15166 [Trypoxylus dichotomus]